MRAVSRFSTGVRGWPVATISSSSFLAWFSTSANCMRLMSTMHTATWGSPSRSVSVRCSSCGRISPLRVWKLQGRVSEPLCCSWASTPPSVSAEGRPSGWRSGHSKASGMPRNACGS